MTKLLLATLLFAPIFGYSQSVVNENWVFGITIDDPWSNTSDIVDAFNSHCLKPTARIVFDENSAANEYTTVVNQLAPACFIMGELLDSYYVTDYSIEQYLNRTTEYLDEFQDVIDIWEVGNEVNGDWVGSASDVIQKIEGAYNIVKNHGKTTALTLYYNHACYYDHPENEMFTWIHDNLPASMKQGLDYVLVSYYEDDCEDVQLTTEQWQEVFDSLHVIFPNSKLGMGECGTINETSKAEYMDRYYKMNITTTNYIGGYFWWYYKHDCIPKTKPLWDTINQLSCTHLPLPVEYFSNLYGKANINTIDLFWTTTIEVDADYFLLERLSPNGKWQTLQKLSPNRQYYHTVDTSPNFGENIYRLQQVGFNGRINHSSNTSIWFAPSSLTIQPNPTSQTVQVKLGQNPIDFIYITNQFGQIPLVVKKPHSALNISNLPNGIYTLHILSNKLFFRKKLIIQH